MTETEVSMDRLKHALCVDIDANASLDLTTHKPPKHEQVKDASPTEQTPHSHDAPHHDTLGKKTIHPASPEAMSHDYDTPEPTSIQQITPQSTTPVNKTRNSASPQPLSLDHDSPKPTPHSDSHKRALIANDTNEHDPSSTSPEHERDSRGQSSSNRDVLEQSTPDCIPGDDAIDQSVSELDKDSEQDKMQKTAATFVEKVLSGIGQISLELQQESLSSKSESRDQNLSENVPIQTSSITLNRPDASVEQPSPEQADSEEKHANDSNREVCM